MAMVLHILLNFSMAQDPSSRTVSQIHLLRLGRHNSIPFMATQWGFDADSDHELPTSVDRVCTAPIVTFLCSISIMSFFEREVLEKSGRFAPHAMPVAI